MRTQEMFGIVQSSLRTALLASCLIACSALSNAAQAHPDMSAILNAYGIQAHRDLSYVPGSKSRSQMLDLYLPRQDEKNANRRLPLIIWVHGGGWTAGDKAGGPFGPLLKAGYAVASINYRFSQEAVYPAQIYDCKAAVRYLRAHADEYHLDPKRFGAWGASAGGHLVALLGTTDGVKSLEGSEGNNNKSSRVEAVCDYFGPTDLISAESQRGEDVPLLKALLGARPKDNPQAAKSASPVMFVSRKSAPFFIAHGDKDPVVPIEQSKELDEALKKAGVETHLEIIQGGDHGLVAQSGKLTPMVIDFFNQHLSK